jgi:adenine-specific DNA-methyltransferase
MPPRKTTPTLAATTASYRHPAARALVRPEAGAQTRFKKKKPTAAYRYDASLAPEMQWDAQNPAREAGEARIAELEAALAKLATRPDDGDALHAARQALADLKALSRPFLNWAGKAEHLSFDVPTLPLFIHERLSTQAILDSVKRFEAGGQMSFEGFFGHPERSLPEQLRMAYEHPNGWQNRMVLGDSLVAMNSLLHYENMGGQVQMIYIDPPYGVKFGSNFQPFVRKRDVAHNDDEDLTREPEMVKAYRDTWELGLHSYLTYLRDRLLLARDLLTESGSVFVQISDENLHHVREVMDEVFGAGNCVSVISFAKTTSASGDLLASVNDFLLWYAKDRSRLKYNQIYLSRLGEGWVNYDYVKTAGGECRRMTPEERQDWGKLPDDSVVYRRDNITSQRPAGDGDVRSFEFEGKVYRPGKGTFKTDLKGLQNLATAGRLEGYGVTLSYRRFVSDFPYMPLNNQWTDTQTGGYAEARFYVVQTTAKAIQRCILMTTDPGDLVLDPTCGSGTTAYVAEQWGRRWITIDTSRVPLALARQRLLTATFKYYELKEPGRGPAGGFVYREKKNRKGEHVGGIVPHITLGSIANNEPPKYEVLVDRPEEQSGITRVCGPFVFEATIPTASNFGADDENGCRPASADFSAEAAEGFVDRMIEVLRASPVLHLPGGKTVPLDGIRRPAKTLYLCAEAVVRPQADLAAALEDADAANGGLALRQGEPVALLFGPEHGPVAEVAVLNAWQEATAKGFTHLYVIGFAIEPKARQAIDEYSAMGMPTTYVQATPDILMGDLLKNMRSSQIFSVCGQPDVAVREVPPPEGSIPNQAYYEVKLNGLDVFDPVTMEIDTRTGLDVPAWFLDTDYNGMVFRVCQAFFPRTQSWDNLKRALKADFDESVWAHLAGDSSTPFAAGQHKQIAVKVIDDRGNELMVVRKLEERK